MQGLRVLGFEGFRVLGLGFGVLRVKSKKYRFLHVSYVNHLFGLGQVLCSCLAVEVWAPSMGP